jgi:hypothetical protein
METNNEKWLPILGFPGYDVSNMGRIRSYWMNGLSQMSKKPQRILKPESDGGYGYLRVKLCHGSRRCRQRIHRLVTEAFLGPRPVGLHTSHINEDPLDNHIINLCYETVKANHQRPKRHYRSSAARIGKQQKHIVGVSGYQGVCRHGKRWCARIKYYNRCIHIGTFDTTREAALAYDVKALELHGKNAITNKSLGLLL